MSKRSLLFVNSYRTINLEQRNLLYYVRNLLKYFFIVKVLIVGFKYLFKYIQYHSRSYFYQHQQAKHFRQFITDNFFKDPECRALAVCRSTNRGCRCRQVHHALLRTYNHMPVPEELIVAQVVEPQHPHGSSISSCNLHVSQTKLVKSGKNSILPL